MRYMQVDLGAMVMEPDKLFVLLVTEADPNLLPYPVESLASLNGLMRSSISDIMLAFIEGGEWTVWREVSDEIHTS